MCHLKYIIRKENLEKRLPMQERSALERLQRELGTQGIKEMIYTEADQKNGMELFLEKQKILPQESLLLATTPEEVDWAKAVLKPGIVAVAGYEIPDVPEQKSLQGVDMLLLGLEEVDAEFFLRIFQRKHHLPWHILDTKRCYLREITLDDLDDLFALYQKKGVTDYIEPLYERKEEEEYQRAYIENMYGYYGYGMWLVKEKDTHKLIGRAGIDCRMLGEEEILEMGYVIAPEYQRQGYAYEVCQAIMDWVKEHTGFSRIDCLVEPGNTASVALLRKLGFQETEKISENEKVFRRFWYFYT